MEPTALVELNLTEQELRSVIESLTEIVNRTAEETGIALIDPEKQVVIISLVDTHSEDV